MSNQCCDRARPLLAVGSVPLEGRSAVQSAGPALALQKLVANPHVSTLTLIWWLLNLGINSPFLAATVNQMRHVQ